MSEPRLHIKNTATGNLLHVDGSWKADTVGDDHANDRDVLMKGQWREKAGKVVKVVMIRTDAHPQSLLDASDLAYQGGAADANKCYEKNRWWKVAFADLSETDVTVMFESYTKQGMYLAETVDGGKVELMPIAGTLPVSEAPKRAKWDLTIAGRAFTPREATAIIIGTPFAAVVAGLGGAGVVAGLGAALTAAGVTTVGGLTAATAAGGVIGGISGATATVLANALENVSEELFVDW